MTKIWYPVLPGQSRSNVGLGFSKYVGEGQLEPREEKVINALKFCCLFG